MALTYEEFIKVVPNETKEFMWKSLPELWWYILNEKELYLKIDTRSSKTLSKKEKVIYIFLKQLYEDNDCKNILYRNGYSPNQTIMSEKISTGYPSERFEDLSYLFNILDNDVGYAGLTPIDITLHAMSYAVKNNSMEVEELEKIQKQLEILNKAKKEEMEKEIELEIYQNLSAESIGYLENASKIREVIYAELKKNTLLFDGQISTSIEDIISLSLLLAIYYHKQQSPDNKTGELAIIQMLLEDHGVTEGKIYDYIKCAYDQLNGYKQKRNIYAIQKEYQKYYQIEESEQIQRITPCTIVERLLDRSISESVVVEKILEGLGCTEKLDFSKENIKYQKEILQKKEQTRLLQELSLSLPLESQKLIEFATKTYTYLKSRESSYNQEIIQTDNDIEVLALYIASHYFNSSLEQFFCDCGVQFNEVLKYIKVSVEKSEVEQEKLDVRVMSERYRRYIVSGTNYQKEMESIDINKIIENACSVRFTMSSILQKIFEQLKNSNEITLDKCFSEQMSKRLKELEINRKNQLKKEFFQDMPKETIQFLENVAMIHTILQKREKDWEIKKLQLVSLLSAILIDEKNPMFEIFTKLGVTMELLRVHFDFDDIQFNILDKKTHEPEIDIEILGKEYKKFIFDGKNKDIPRQELNIKDIFRNVFQEDFSDIAGVNKLFTECNITYQELADFDTLYLKVKKELAAEKIRERAQNILDEYKFICQGNIIASIHIYERMKEELKKNPDFASHINNEEEIKILAILLNFYTYQNEKTKYLEENGLDVKSLLSYLNLKDSILENIDIDEVDDTLLIDFYETYYQEVTSYSPLFEADLIKMIFNESRSTNRIIQEIIQGLDISYEKVKYEVINQSNYEESINAAARIQLLAKEPVKDLNLENISGILNYGNTLTKHSKYIYDEYSKLVQSDIHDQSIQVVNDAISKSYMAERREEPIQSFFAKFFQKNTAPKIENIEIDINEIQVLNETIAKSIQNLSQELLRYDTIRKYIEVYRKKNLSYLQTTTKALQTIEQQVKELSPEEDEEYADFLRVQSMLQILQDKVNRFTTSSFLMKQELVKVNQSIVNHFITINALEMARDDLLPLISSELAIAKGINTTNQALSLSGSVMELFQSLLTRNINGIIESTSNLQKSSIPDPVFQLINQSVAEYMNQVQQANVIKLQLEDFSDAEIIINSTEESMDMQKKKTMNS